MHLSKWHKSKHIQNCQTQAKKASVVQISVGVLYEIQACYPESQCIVLLKCIGHQAQCEEQAMRAMTDSY